MTENSAFERRKAFLLSVRKETKIESPRYVSETRQYREKESDIENLLLNFHGPHAQ